MCGVLQNLYQLSLLKEPTSGSAADSKKKFPWLPK